MSLSQRAFSDTLDWALKMILVIAIPSAITSGLLAEPILLTLFFYGEVMTLRDMSMAALAWELTLQVLLHLC